MDNYIFPHMGPMKLIDVKLIHVQELPNKMGEEDLSQSLQNKVLITLNAMFKYAMLNGLLVGNPAEFAEICEVPIKKVEALTPEQVKEILTVCREWERNKFSTRPDRAELAIHMGLFLALRRGELIPTQLTDLNSKTRTIKIKTAVELTKNQPKIKDTKTPAGERIMPVPDHLWKMIINTKRTSMYIVPSAKDVMMSKSAFRRMLEPLQERLSFEFHFHQLRHTYATLLEKLDVSPKMCQYLIGHASDHTTKKIYTHIQEDYVMSVVPRLNNILTFSQKTVWGSEGGQSSINDRYNADKFALSLS